MVSDFAFTSGAKSTASNVSQDARKAASDATSAGSSSAHSAGASSSSKTSTSSKHRTAATNIETLAKTTEFRWFLAHVTVVISTLLSLLLFRNTRVSNAAYRVGFSAAFVSCGLILFQKYGKLKPSFNLLSHDDNLHYAVFTLVWLFTGRRTLALLPLAIFSLFHTLTYTRTYLLPALGLANSPLIGRIDYVVKNYNEPLTILAANFEIVLALQLVVLALTFARGSWIQLVGYVAFFRLRYATSAYTRHALKAWEIRADQLLGHPSMSPKLKEFWAQIKGFLAKIPGPANRA